MRLLIAVCLSFIISISIFFLMQEMITSDSKVIQKNTNPIELVYLRYKKYTNIEKKNRVKPKEPIKKIEPKKLEIKTNLNKELDKNVKIKPLEINRNIDISSISSLAGAKIELGSNLLDANMLTTLNRVHSRARND